MLPDLKQPLPSVAGLLRKYSWKFYLDDNDVWRWVKRTLDGKTVEASSGGFAHAKDAVADAEKNGYKG